MTTKDLIDEARSRTYTPSRPGTLITRLADALEVAEKRLQEVEADRWDEGFAAGVNHDMGDWEVPPEPIDNPYRKTEEEK